MPQGEVRQASTMYWIPGGARIDALRSATLPGADFEARWGLSGTTDVGMRDRKVIVVPSVTVHGDVFRRLLRPW